MNLQEWYNRIAPELLSRDGVAALVVITAGKELQIASNMDGQLTNLLLLDAVASTIKNIMPPSDELEMFHMAVEDYIETVKESIQKGFENEQRH